MTGRDGDPAGDPPGVGRRQLLGGMAASGTLTGLPDELEGLLEEALGEKAVDDATTDPHTEATFRAFVAAVVPSTPKLARRRGDDHESSAEDVGVERFVIWFLNRSLESGLYQLIDEPVPVRLAEGVANSLDAGATALLAQGENERDPDPSRYQAGGPFAALAPEDRFRAVSQVESLPPEALPAPFDRLHHQIGYVVQAIHLLVTAGYYSEWAGYGATRTADPSDWTYTESVPSRAQTGYPGPIVGAADHRGYEVQRFRENDYTTTGGSSGEASANDEALLETEVNRRDE